MKKSQDVFQEKFKIFTDEVSGARLLVDGQTGETFEVLRDFSSTGRLRPWAQHKATNERLQYIYNLISQELLVDDSSYWASKADRLSACGSTLCFNRYYDATTDKSTLKATHLESCRVRLCPLCTWRRSLKIGSHVRKILEAMQAENKGYSYILLTLTIRNPKGEDLSERITDMMRAWNDYKGLKPFKKAVRGWYRALEITHNVDKKSPSFDTYHPHFHVILAVDDKKYFEGDEYIRQSWYLKAWQQAMQDPEIKKVDVRKIRPKPGYEDGGVMGAVCETTKYTTEPEDYVLPWNWELSCDTVKILDHALTRRRLVAFGGVMKDWHHRLNLDDEIDGDLLHVDDDVSELGEKIGEVCAFWHAGYQQYIIK